LEALKTRKQTRVGYKKEDDACLSLRLGMALRTCKVSSIDRIPYPWDYVYTLYIIYENYDNSRVQVL
jgi:hypothetical protein